MSFADHLNDSYDLDHLDVLAHVMQMVPLDWRLSCVIKMHEGMWIVEQIMHG